MPTQMPKPMTDAEFKQWVALLEQRAGLIWPLERKSSLVTSVELRMRQIRQPNFQAYLDYLQQQDIEEQEWRVLIDRLTVHETRFFRHPDSLALIQNYWLKPYLRKNHNQVLKGLSVGCATGEEVYTLAMMIADSLVEVGSNQDWHLQGLDISAACLAIASAGHYRPRQITTLPKDLQERYGIIQEDGRWQVRAELRQKIQFIEFNLLHIEQPAWEALHLIVCQNVLIYFAWQRAQAILEALVQALLPGGLLVLAPGEMVGWHHPWLKAVYYNGAVAFCRLDHENTKGISDE